MSDEKEDKIPKFNGTAEGWTYFSPKFKSVLTNKNMRELLKAVRTTGDEIPKDSDDCTVEVMVNNAAVRRADPTKTKVKEQNAKAFSLLVCNISTQKRPGKIAFDLVMKHQTGGAEGDQGDYPEGNFKTAWLALEKKYNPKTIKTKTELKQEYNDMRLAFGRDERPSEFIHKMETIRLKLESGADKALFAVTDATFKIDILSRLPGATKEGEEGPYETVRSKVMKELTADPDSWTVEAIKDDLDERHDVLFPKKAGTNDGEVGLPAFGQVKIKCNKCGQWDHKSQNCPNNGKQSGGNGGGGGNGKGKHKSGKTGDQARDKSKLECWHCKKKGHIRADCWDLKKKREGNQEQGNAAQEEVVLAVVESTEEAEECYSFASVGDSFFDSFGSGASKADI